MPYPNEHAARVKDPDGFEPNSFRSKDLKGGIRIIVGKLKGGDAMVLQAYRFSLDQFTVEQAKKWLEDHKISYLKFEPAQSKSEIGGSVNNVKKQIEHTGVLGMKWGRRSGGGAHPSGKKSSTSSADHAVSRKIKGKKLSEMSNEEIQQLSKRLRLEKELKDLSPTAASKGKKAVVGALGMVGTALMSQVATTVAKKIFDTAAKKLTNP